MLDTSLQDQVLTLTLNGPSSVNALNEQNYEALHVALSDARSHPDVRAVVMTASGQKAFCAGADLKEYADRDPHEAEQLQMKFLLRMLIDLVEFPKPVVAAVQAPAIGAGMMLACACDEIVMADETWMSLPEAQINIPAPIAAVIVGRRLRLGAMHALLQRADRISSAQSMTEGLVDELAPPRDVCQKAHQRLSVYSRISPQVYELNKRWLNRGLRDQLEIASRAVRI